MERAIRNLRLSGSLTIDGIRAAELRELELLVRPSGYSQKGIGPETADSILLYAGYHPIFVVDAYTRRVLERHDAIHPKSRYDEIRSLVEDALATAEPSVIDDSVVLGPRGPTVHEPSRMSTAAKSQLIETYNEMHGLFVQLGKHYCSKQNPQCEVCPLGPMLQRGRTKSRV